MADPINHDGLSSAATVGMKAAKWGLMGALVAFALPALVIGGTSLAVGAAIGGAIGSVIGIGGLVAGVATGAVSAFSFGSTAAIAGGIVGAARGGDQVNREATAYRNRGAGVQNGKAKLFNDGEVRGLQEGYQIARADMEPMIQQREQAAFQKGQEYVVHQIQEQMNAQMQAAAAQAPGQTQALAQNQNQAQTPAKVGAFADKALTLKCESKAQAVLEQRKLDAMAQKQI